MQPADSERLIRAIEKNTATLAALAQAMHAQAVAVARLADEAVNLVALLAEQEQEEADPDVPLTVDMAGRPIKDN